MEQPQMALVGEQVIADPEFEGVLESREIAKEQRGRAQAAFKEKDSQVKARIATLGIAEGKVRCGRWVITIEQRPGRSVAFETSPSKRILVKANSG